MFAGPWELILLAFVILLLFGKRLPSLMNNMGRSVVEFKKGIKDEDGDPEASTSESSSSGASS